MEGNYVSGIDTSKINSLYLDINNYAEEINNILTNIDDLITENMAYLNISAKDKFKKIHSENKQSFQIVVKNILCYADDLLKVKKIYSEKTYEISQNFNKSNSK